MSPSTEPFNEVRYKALMDGLECSEIMLSSLERTLRIDAEFYRKENLWIDSLLSTWDKMPFSDCFRISDGNHMSISESFCDEGIPYYRGQDTYHLFIEQATPYRIDKQTFNKSQMHRSHLHQGDVLVSIVGTIGNSSLVTTNEDSTCSCKLAIMRPKGMVILPEMLLVYIKTKYGQVQIQKFKRGAVQTGLLLEDFDQLYIPAFSMDFQSKIRDIVRTTKAYQESANERYRNAESILLSALNYHPIVQTQGYLEKSFSVSFGVTGRLDAEYYQPKYDELFQLLSALPTKQLQEIVTITKSIEPGSEYYGNEGIPFIRVSDVSKDGINVPSIRIPKATVPSIENLYPKKDTILFSKDGSVGIAYKIEDDIEAVTSGALLHLTVKDTTRALPDYLTLLLNSDIVKLQAERDTSGAIIQHWKPSDIERAVVPILPLKIQRQIAEKIEKSFSLRHQSKQLLENAKHTVELAIEQGEDKAMGWLQEQGEIYS